MQLNGNRDFKLWFVKPLYIEFLSVLYCKICKRGRGVKISPKSSLGRKWMLHCIVFLLFQLILGKLTITTGLVISTVISIKSIFVLGGHVRQTKGSVAL